jgi:hypothetical protein
MTAPRVTGIEKPVQAALTGGAGLGSTKCGGGAINPA